MTRRDTAAERVLFALVAKRALRSGSAEASAALSRQSRYQDVAENLRAREVRIAGTSGS